MEKNKTKYIFLIYFYIPEIFITNVSTRSLSTESTFRFVFSSCEFTKVIL